MRLLPLRRALALCLASCLCSATPALSQALTPAQKSACDRHHEGRSCLRLKFEFERAQSLLHGSPALIDNPMQDADALGEKLAPKAFAQVLLTGLREKAAQTAQAALQTISTSAAVTQVGGSSTSSGSTNLVAKPTTTDFISLAAESGAFTDTLNGNTVTLQGNALGLTKYLANLPVFVRINSRLADAFQPLTFTVSLNVERSGTSTATTSGVANTFTPAGIAAILLPTSNASFASFGVNYQIYRPYNPQKKNFQVAWNQALLKNQAALDATGKAIAVSVDTLWTPDVLASMSPALQPVLDQWHKAGSAAEASNNFDDFVAAYDVYVNAYCDFLLATPDGPNNALTLVHTLDAFNAAVYTVLNQARGTPLATVSYLYATPAQQPAYNQATLVFSQLFRGGKPRLNADLQPTGDHDDTRTFLSGVQITGNYTSSLYASLPPGVSYGRLRDVQLSAEFDKPLGGTLAEPRAIFSLAGYGQYQFDPTVLNITAGNLAPGTNITLPSNAQVLLGTSGWLGVVQGKLVINLRPGLTLPIALKYSNKTDLLNSNDVRGQFGLSYDLSALGKLISPGK